jgi:hypothetical protein
VREPYLSVHPTDCPYPTADSTRSGTHCLRGSVDRQVESGDRSEDASSGCVVIASSARAETYPRVAQLGSRVRDASARRATSSSFALLLANSRRRFARTT